MEPVCSNWVNKLFEVNLEEQINMDSNPFYYQIKTWMPDCSIKIEMDDFRSFFARVKKYKGSANVYEIFCRALLKNDHERELDQFLKCPDTDKELKLTIVKELAKKGSSRISTFGNVNEYEVTSEKDRIEIIKSLITSSFFLERVLERFKEYQITDQEALIELANYAAKKKRYTTLLYLANFGIHDEYIVRKIAIKAAKYDEKALKWVKHFGNVSEDELVTIIKDVVPDQGYEIALWIPFAYIKNQSAIIEIARLVAETNSLAILEYIHRFGIEDENIQLEIIEIAAQKHSIKLPYVRGTSSLSNQQKIIEIGKLYGNDNCFMAIGWIKRFNIEDQNVRIEMAKTLSEKAEEYLSMCFNEFGITDAKARAEIAMSAAKKRGYQTCEYIENYEIQDEEVLFNIAKAAVDDNPNACRLFGNFKIQDESLRVAFAMHVANKNGGVISENISHVVISDENDRIKIAKQAAMNDGHSVSKNIQSFAIENQEALFEIAKLAAMNNPGWTAKLFRNFGISNEKYRVEIAKIIAQRHSEGISSNIRDFKIEDQNALKEIAILSAINHGYNTSMSIQNYGLESEEARIEVAMAAGGQGCNYFANFEIENLEARIRIAKHVMPAEHIKTFKIYDKKVRAEIALLAAQQPGGYYNGDGDISQNIKKFEIDEASRIAVAKIAAQKNGCWTTQHFDNYEIESEKTRIEIAKISVRQDGPNTIRFIRKYNIEQTDKVFEFLLIAISNSEETFKNLKSFPKTPYDELVKIFVLLGEDNVDLNEVLNKFSSFFQNKWNMTLDVKTIKEVQDVHAKKALVIWLGYTIGKCMLRSIKEEEMKWILESKGLINLQDYRDPQKRFRITDYLVKLARSKRGKETFDSLNNKSIPASLLSSFLFRHVDDKDIFHFAGHLKKGYFKDPRNNMLLINTLTLLLNEKSFTKEDLTYLLQLTFVSDTLMKLSQIDTIMGLGGASYLHKERLMKTSNDLQSFVIDLFRKIIPIKDTSNFCEKYQKLMDSLRMPNCLMIYASKLNMLDDKKPMEALARFVESLLEGTFLEERYQPSLHLDTVFKDNEPLLAEWKKGQKKVWTPIEMKEPEEEIDFHKIISEAVIGHKHLDWNLHPYVVEFLQGGQDLLKKLGDELRITKKGSHKSNKLLFQRHCIRFLNDKLNSSEQRTELKKMEAFLRESDEGGRDFFADIEWMIQRLEKNIDDFDGWTIVDSDDPQDLFLCGTEVLGSCQRISGEVRQNQCLLGYVLDGKNRIIALKNREGKIVSRAILRILWDSKNKKSVLFMESIYPPEVDVRYQQAIIELAKERATALGLTLLSLEKGEKYDGILESLSCRAPYEYCDAIRGITNGLFTILNACILQEARF